MTGTGGAFLTKELRLRIVSALVMIVVALIATWIGGLAFRFLCVAIVAAVFYEWLQMAKAYISTTDQQLSVGLVVAICMVILALPGAATGFAIVVALAALSAMAAGALGSSRWSAAGLLYSGIAGLSLVLLRDTGLPGFKTVVFLFVVVWATDILAYFVGRAVGGPKLAPAISPGKTWSGACGGTLAALILGLAAALGMDTRLPLTGLILLIILLSAVSQVGDLFESWLKRRFQVKDSSHIIPGHGGVMDRVDGLVAASVVLYVIGVILADSDAPALAFF
ncbi:phosphatidate cytidylyltransferase [Aliihoeflea sp. PC F10.4]